MHIPKLLAIISVVTLGAGSLSVHAQRPDSDMQAIAREQMRQALAKMDATNAGTATNMPAAPVKPKPVKKVVAPPPAQPTMVIAPPTPKPVPPPPAVVPPPAQVRTVAPPQAAPAMQPAAVSVPEQSKPVAAATKKAPPAKATGFSPYSPIAESPSPGNPPVTLVIPGESPVVAPGNALKRSDERKAREELRKSLGETEPNGKSEAKFPTEAKMGTENVTATTPRTAVPGSKEDRLADLLDQYKADKISPQEYHDQRAKIIAEP